MDNLPVFVKEYLEKYSQSNWNVEYKKNLLFNYIVVIPAICEYENIIKLLLSLLNIDNKYFPNTLFLFVVNNKSKISEEIINDNLKSLELLRSIIKNENKFLKNKIDLFITSSNLNIGVIDATCNGKTLPDKTAGVGLARKIGMDCALKLFDYTSNKKNILICLDADCTVSKNYLTEIVESFNKEKINCAVIRYEHDISKNNEETKAIVCYEIFLRYYQLGLLYSNSPYAFPTIGSAMACDVDSYIRIEGMNKQKAAEDFYFLEKLAKNYEIKEINKAVVYPSARKSWRVPFGTGQRVNRFLSKEKDEYLLHNPLCFNILKKWNDLFLNENDVQKILIESKKISSHLYNFLIEQNFMKAMDGIKKHSKSPKQFNRQKIRWFDGFKTLKLIHYLRDNAYPEINMFDALDEMFEKLNINFNVNRIKGDIPFLDFQKKYLIEMRDYLYN